MTVLVFGKEGQVARALAEAAGEGWTFAGRDRVDLMQAGASTHLIKTVRPDLVINTAAFTDVDGAEARVQDAGRLNADAAGEIAQAARSVGAGIIHLSTDYVFDGSAQAPISEDAPTAPLNVYGATKLAGEGEVAVASPDHVILRTSWVVSPFGRNFVRTMLRLAEDRDEIAVVDDQLGRPTSATDLAAAIHAIASRWRRIDKGIYHLAGGGQPTSWAGLADRIMTARRALVGSAPAIRPIATSDYPVAAIRPAYTVLDSSKAQRQWGIGLPAWGPAVDRIVACLLDPAEA